MAKETVIFRQGPLDGQTREVESSINYYTHDEIKPDLTIIHHYKREKKETKVVGKLEEFILDHIEHKKSDQ